MKLLTVSASRDESTYLKLQHMKLLTVSASRDE